jgi:hypothetical protein
VCDLPEIQEAVNDQAMIVSRGGGVIQESHYKSVRVGDLDVLLFMPGTHDDQTTAVVGMLALAAIAPGLGNVLTGAAWGAEATLASTIVAGAVVVGGGLLINSMGPKPEKPSPATADPDESSNSRGWIPATVQRAGIKRPRVYGEIKITGILVQTAWDYASDTQLDLYALVLLGDGPFEQPVVPGTVKLYGQPSDNYDAANIDVRTRWGNINQYQFANTRYQWYQCRPFSKVTNSAGPVEFDTYGSIFDRLVFLISFPAGLYDGTGASPASLTVNVTIKIRKTNSTVWQTVVNNEAITETETDPVYRQYDTDDYIGSQDRHTRYTVQVTRETADRSGLYFDEMYIDLVREVLDLSLTRPGQALVEVHAYDATDYVSGPFRFECVSRGRPIRIYDDPSWSIAYADRLAWVLYDCFTQPVLTGSHSAFKDLDLLLHFEGSNGDTETLDSAPYGKPVTFYNTAQISTAASKFGSSSCWFDGNSDYITIPNAGRDFVHNFYEDWTIDFFVNHDLHATTECYLDFWEDNDNRWRLYHVHGSGIRFDYEKAGSTAIDTGPGSEITDTSWHHIALCKVGTEYGLYLDGTQCAHASDESRGRLRGTLYVGAENNVGNYFDGSIDELRIIHRNIFSAAPVSGLSDTITEPVAAYTDPGNTYADGAHECYADSQMDLDAFEDADEWCDAPRVNPDRIYIDAITQTADALVTTRSPSKLRPGDKVLFRNVSQNGMTQLVDGTTATVLSEVDSVTLRTDLDASAYSAYESLNKLLYQFEEADGSDYTNDRSPQGHDANNTHFNGTAQVSTAAYKWGGGSLLLDGTGDYIQLANDDDWDIAGSASDTWTIDFQVKFDLHDATETIIAHDRLWHRDHRHQLASRRPRQDRRRVRDLC